MEYYNEAELLSVKKQRNKLLVWYIVILAIYAFASVGIFVWYKLLPYGSNQTTIIRLIEYPLTFVFVLFSFIYLGIPYSRANKYYKLCVRLQTGKRETFEGEFTGYDGEKNIKDGVDVKSLLFEEYNEYKKSDFERKVLVFYEKPFPELEKGARYKFITQGNVMIEYEKIDSESKAKEKKVKE